MWCQPAGPATPANGISKSLLGFAENTWTKRPSSPGNAKSSPDSNPSWAIPPPSRHRNSDCPTSQRDRPALTPWPLSGSPQSVGYFRDELNQAGFPSQRALMTLNQLTLRSPLGLSPTSSRPMVTRATLGASRSRTSSSLSGLHSQQYGRTPIPQALSQGSQKLHLGRCHGVVFKVEEGALVHVTDDSCARPQHPAPCGRTLCLLSSAQGRAL